MFWRLKMMLQMNVYIVDEDTSPLKLGEGYYRNCASRRTTVQELPVAAH
jgi:hypothetical protein